MNRKILKIVLAILNSIKILALVHLILWEIGSIKNDLDYRFQYLFILYFTVPALLIEELFGCIVLQRLMKRLPAMALFSFIIGISLFVAVYNEVRFSELSASYIFICIEFVGILLFGYSLAKVINFKPIERD